MNRFKLGVPLEVTGQPPRLALAQAARLGVQGVQVDAAGDLVPDRITATGRREFRTLLRSFDVELAALNCPLRRGLDSTEDPQRRIEHVRKVMQLAVDLGTGVVVAPLPRLPAEPTDEAALTLRDALTDLGRFGDRVGARLALEVGFDPGEKVNDYLAAYDTGGLAVTFDPANFLLNGQDPLANLTALAGRVAYTRARDGRTATVSGGAREAPVGAGDVEWMGYVATLESIDYRGYLTVDRHNGTSRFADVAAGVKFLRRFVPAPQG